MAISSSYCTHRDLKDVYPNVDEYDVKNPIYGWQATGVSNQYIANDSGLVTALFVDGKDLGAAQSDVSTVTTDDRWFYDSTIDAVYYFNDGFNPVNKLMESGEDFATLITRTIKNASRYFDARVDGGVPRDQWKDKEGNFDYLVVRTTSLIAAYMLINSKEPGSELAMTFLNEANFNIEQINSGKSKLSYQVSSDSSQGVLREVLAPQNANPLRIVDTRGNYLGSYDLLKIIVTTAGAIGTAKFSVYGKSTNSLKADLKVENEIINGQYQSIGNGLDIRFQGKDSSSVGTVNDEWELEVWGIYESLDGSPGSGLNTRMTRKGGARHFYRNKL